MTTQLYNKVISSYITVTFNHWNGLEFQLEIDGVKYFFTKSSDCDELLNQFDVYKITVGGMELPEAELIILDKKIDLLIEEIKSRKHEPTEEEKLWYYHEQANDHLCNAVEQMKEFMVENCPYGSGTVAKMAHLQKRNWIG